PSWRFARPLGKLFDNLSQSRVPFRGVNDCIADKSGLDFPTNRHFPRDDQRIDGLLARGVHVRVHAAVAVQDFVARDVGSVLPNGIGRHELFGAVVQFPVPEAERLDSLVVPEGAPPRRMLLPPGGRQRDQVLRWRRANPNLMNGLHASCLQGMNGAAESYARGLREWIGSPVGRALERGSDGNN